VSIYHLIALKSNLTWVKGTGKSAKARGARHLTFTFDEKVYNGSWICSNGKY
jgi:hypothetical protein